MPLNQMTEPNQINCLQIFLTIESSKNYLQKMLCPWKWQTKPNFDRNFNKNEMNLKQNYSEAQTQFVAQEWWLMQFRQERSSYHFDGGSSGGWEIFFT